MKCVEFMGMPKAGKSTQLDLLETILKHKRNNSVEVICEGARVSPLDKKERFYYNSWSFHNTINRVMEAGLRDPDYLLVDRGVYDHVAFVRALYYNGTISKNQYKVQEKYFYEFCSLEDFVMGFMITPNEAMKRENKHLRNLTEDCGRVMNENFLNFLNISYTEVMSENSSSIIPIDGSLDIEDNFNKIYSYF